jgi:hypothetical protein
MTTALSAARSAAAAVMALLPANTPWLTVHVGVATGEEAVTPVTVTPPIARPLTRLLICVGLVICATSAAAAAGDPPMPLKVTWSTAGFVPVCVMLIWLGPMPLSSLSRALM